MKRDFEIEIHGNKWLVRFTRLRGKAVGWCDYSKKKIMVADRLPLQAKVDTLIHEVIHAVHSQLSEEAVTYTGTKIAEALFLTGLVEDKEDPK